jgi:tetratricopeptide (TPR) repeat protein
MKVGVQRIACVAAGCLLWLTGCETTSTRLPDIFTANSSGGPAGPAVAASEASGLDTTGSLSAPLPANGPGPNAGAEQGARGVLPLMGADPNDDLSVAKQYYRQGSYGLAERHFRRAVEQGPRDAEAWLGLAASYDRLKRFDLADRAYDQLLKLAGPTPEILNNQGFSFILRGNYRKARQILLLAQAKDPANPYIRNNLDLLETSARTRKAVE